jgi:hypothetical protein
MEREQRQILKEMFPDLEYKVIDHALKTHQEDPHKAIDWLLMRVFAPLPPCPVPHPSVQNQQTIIDYNKCKLNDYFILK